LPEPRARIVQLVLTLDVGGLEMMVLDYLRYATRARFDHEVVCLRGPGELARRFADAGIPVTPLEAGGRVASFTRLAAHLRRRRPDVVHTHNSGPHWYAALARSVVGSPLLVHTKHGRNIRKEARHVWANRVASRLSDVVVPVSEDAADEVRGLEQVPAEKVVVIHNGIELDRFAAPPRPPRPPLRAISVARLNSVKDQPTLLRAARLLADTHPGFSLDVVGDGPERASLERLRVELGLERTVRLLGQSGDVASSLARSDLFLLTSTSEGLALTLLEAMASGLPVVATDVGGNREVVVPGETGLLVRPGSPAAVADAVRQLLDAPERAAAMGRAGRRRVEQWFDIRVMVARYERLYDDLRARRSAAR
jgi:sugar transferase (PEP-CTERM/EpsH1 system associated)